MSMGAAIDYYLTPVSPWTYLGHERLAVIAGRHGAAIRCKPVDFGKIFAVSGGLPLGKRAPQRQAYRLFELKRWRDFLGIELTLEPRFFPAPADLAAKLILAAPETAQFRLVGALLRAIWAEERDIADPATAQAIAESCGLDGAALLRAAEGPALKARYEDLTREAIDRQVFGAPTYIFRDEPFWGQDRLDFLERVVAMDRTKKDKGQKR
ncbi:MAG: 2-hydroxychromene-2-carboxylate isomerase [Roseiarcus sp.]